MAQFGSALPWGGRGREFKSPYSDHFEHARLSMKIGSLFCCSQKKIFIKAGKSMKED